MTDDAAVLGKQCWQTLEVVHILGYFDPGPTAAYKALGLGGRQGYFACRSAPMGAVAAEVVTATFYVFSPTAVAAAIPKAWQLASPEQILKARHAAMTEVMHRVVDPAGLPAEHLEELVSLARTACAGLSQVGRPLFAGHSSLPWPEDPLLALWHAATLLREHRGDGHIAALLTAGLGPLEAMITYGTGNGMLDFLKATRGWSEAEWQAGVDRTLAAGWLTADGALTPAGVAVRADVEQRTDLLAAEGWEHLGATGAERMRELLRPLPAALGATGLFPASLLRRLG